MAINKVQFGGNTLIDITDTTATASEVLAGKIFYNADGTRGVGTMVDPTPTVLYNNASGTASSITGMSEDTSHFSYLEIYYGWEGGDYGILSTKLDLSKNYNVNLSTSVINNSYIYFAVSEWKPAGTSITLQSAEYWRGRVSSQNAFTRTQSNKVAIYKILGYK